MPATCIITGAAGFIGSHLSADLIRNGHRVVGIDNLDPFYDVALKRANLATAPLDEMELVVADIRDPALDAVFRRVRPSVVFHLAALAGVRQSIAEPDRYVSVNVEGLRHVLDAARAAECPRVVFASSSSVYGQRDSGAFGEADPMGPPISPYAATKQAGEQLCHAWSHVYGLTIAAARLFTAYGPRQRPDLAIARFLSRILAGTPIPMFGDGSTCRDYTFVADVVRGLVSAGEWTGRQPRPACRVFNLGSGRPVALSRLISHIELVVGRSVAVDALPPQPGDVTRTCADLDRSRRELAYEPTVELREGLKQQWEWMERECRSDQAT